VASNAILDYVKVENTIKFNIRDFIPDPRVINTKDYGIKADGVTNNTVSIQSLIDRMVIGDTLHFHKGGTFMLDAVAAKKLIWKSNINIEISPGATLKVITNNSGNYELFDLSNLSNIRIFGGGRLQGERSTHTGTTGEWGMGIMMKKSTNIKIEDIQIDDFWGDGIYIGGDGYGNQSKNIYIRNVHADNNRRQGISVVNVDGLVIEGGSATRTNGTAPQTGIDFEPNNNGEMLKNITISNFATSENAGGSMLFAHAALSRGASNIYPLTDNQISIKISNLYSYKDAKGPYLVSDSHTVFKLSGFIEFNDTTVVEPLKQGLWFNNWREEHMAKVRFNNLSITDVNSNELSEGADAAGVLLSSGGTTDWATDTNRIGYSGVIINNLSIIDTRTIQKTEIGIKTISERFQLQNAKITNYDTNLHESKRLAWIRGEGTVKYIDDRGYKITSGTPSAETTQYFGQTLMTQNGNSYALPHSREHIGKEICFRIPISGAIRFPTIRLSNSTDSFVGCGVLTQTLNGMVLRGKTGNEIRFKAVEDNQWLITYLGEPGTFNAIKQELTYVGSFILEMRCCKLDQEIRITNEEWHRTKAEVEKHKDKLELHEKRINRHSERLDQVEDNNIALPIAIKDAIESSLVPVLTEIRDQNQKIEKQAEKINQLENQKYKSAYDSFYKIIWGLVLLAVTYLGTIVLNNIFG